MNYTYITNNFFINLLKTNGMRKWTYLVAALLMSGATATFTSCIDTEEPAGITELRGAKAELLRAKVKVQDAEAAFRAAEAAWMQAKADYEAEKAAQEALWTAYKEAEYADDMVELAEKAEIRRQEYLEKLYQLQEDAETARLDYERTLASVEIALLTVKDDAYAAALNELLYKKEYTYTTDNYTYDPATGNVTINPTSGATETMTILGLYNLSKEIADLENDLADIIQQNLIVSYQFDKEAYKSDVKAAIAVKEAELKAEEELLAEYKDIKGTSLEDFKAKYEEVEADKEELDAQKANLAIAKAEKLATDYEPKNLEITNKEAAKTALTFEIPQNSIVQDGFYEIISTLYLSAVADADLQSVYDAMKKYAVTDAEGNASFPNGFTVDATIRTQRLALDELEDAVEAKVVSTDVNALKTAKDNADKNVTYYAETYGTALDNWQKAAKAYDAAYANGKYENPETNDYAVVLAAYEVYKKVRDDAEATSADKTAEQTTFITAYKKYLNGESETVKGRTYIDGFKPAEAIDIIADATKITAFDAATDEERFGTQAPTMLNEGGCYKALVDAAEKLGIGVALRTAYTYEEWTVDNEATPSDVPAYVANTSETYKYFTALDKQEEATDEYNNALAIADWTILQENIEKVSEAVLVAFNEIRTERAAVNEIKEAVEREFEAQAAAIDVKLAGLQNVLNAMETVVKAEASAGTPTPTTYAEAIAYIEGKIAAIEGATVDDNPASGNFGSITLGSLSDKKAELALYQNLLKGLEAEGEDAYKTDMEILQAYNQMKIDAINMQLEVLKALFDKANEQKDALLAELTAE